MKSLRSVWMAAVMTICFLTVGCTPINLGPQVRTEYVIQHAGKPSQILENKKVKTRLLDGSGDAVTQDIGGGIWMPFDHWEVIKKRLELGK